MGEHIVAWFKDGIQVTIETLSGNIISGKINDYSNLGITCNNTVIPYTAIDNIKVRAML